MHYLKLDQSVTSYKRPEIHITCYILACATVWTVNIVCTVSFKKCPNHLALTALNYYDSLHKHNLRKDTRPFVIFQKWMHNITYILTVSYKRHQTSPRSTLIPENLKHTLSTCPGRNGDTVVVKYAVHSRERRPFERIHAIVFLYRVTTSIQQWSAYQ